MDECTADPPWWDPPHATPDLPGIGGRLRAELDDFTVDEVPAYAPEGRGDHLFVRLRKRGLTTPQASVRVAEALDADPGGTGWAGLKDRRGVTTQWISLAGGEAERALGLDLEGIEILEAVRHPHKLRTGHLRANRFTLKVRDCHGDLVAARRVMDRLQEVGSPNYFGRQRFGHDGNNIARATRWLVDGRPAPRGRFDRKLLVSALQSAMFNEAASRRVVEGTLDRPVDGDVLRKEDTGGLFVTGDRDEAERRVEAWEVSPTGPMFGVKMRWPEGEALRREQALLTRWGLDEADLRRWRKAGPGARRAFRVRPQDVQVESTVGGILLAFSLPPGAYATTVMREVMKASASGAPSAPTPGPPAP